jgi:predicted outer membrane protein
MFKPLIEMFRVPSPTHLAQRELEEARRELLKAQSGAEYAIAMVDYHRSRIERLRRTLMDPMEAL